MPDPLAFFLAAGFFAALAGPALSQDSAASNTALCEAVRQMVSAPPGKGVERFTPKTQRQGALLKYLGLDLDRDGRHDTVAMGCPAAFKAMHQCVLDVQLSGGAMYTLQEAHLSVIHYRQQTYAVVGERGPGRPAGSAKLLQLGATGVRSMCTGL